jgi:hypothetical protein
MDIKVYDRNLTGAAAGSSARTENTQKTESSPSSGSQSSGRSNAGDQVEFSGTLGRLSQALSNQGTQRAAKVAALAAAYKSGNYVPNAAGASKGLVSEGLSAGGGQ